MSPPSLHCTSIGPYQPESSDCRTGSPDSGHDDEAVEQLDNYKRFCHDLSRTGVKGWDPNLQPTDANILMKSRFELVVLLSRVKLLINKFELSTKPESSESLAYLRRLACKLKYHISPSKASNWPTSTSTSPSEQCAGVVSSPIIVLENIRCTFTSRLLPPVIFQCRDIFPPWLKLKQELYHAAKVRAALPVRSSQFSKCLLTFAHITSNHIPAIKCLIDCYFWSNVDLSVVLRYPEFTCVVFFRKLVVGFGYISPGIHSNEGYVNFLFVRPHWRRCGIAEMILHLLRQQCLYWSLTLHVSPNSDALNLYNKFGFKIQCRIKDFYSGYVVTHKEGDGDALYMKMESRLPQLY